MEELLQRHLVAVAGRMGRHLRGFDDPGIHLGTEATFAHEFDKVFRFPALRVPAEKRPLAYAEAVRRYRFAGVRKAAAGDPVLTMAQGLRGPQTLSHEPRRALSPEPLFEDLASLLRTPLLRFYLQITEAEAFGRHLEATARRGGFALAVGTRESEPACPACGRLLGRAAPGAPVHCPGCDRRYETVTWLPLVRGVAASVSYEFLRRLVVLDCVAAYQEESRIAHAPFEEAEP